MIGRIGDEKIEEIRERTDIVTLVSSYLQLKRSGANHFGLCPFHTEKSPSFSVSAPRQTFHCFGCNEGGDVFAFLMKMEGLSFPEAARRLAGLAGVEIPEEAPDPEEDRRRRERERLLAVNEAARDYYQQLLLREPEGEPGRQYLKGRGFDSALARAYGLGYAPDRWEGLARHLSEQGLDPEAARTLGLVRPGREGRGDYDLFRGRLIFPILGLTGQVAAFGARTLGEAQPKYINSPESPVYHKGGVLYGLYQAREGIRRQGEVILVEGYFDLLALHRAGFTHVVATCGTALTEEQVGLLKRYARKVLLLFDQDAAGRKATWRALDLLLPTGLPAAVVGLDPGEDPDSFLARRGVENFRERLAAARPALELFMEESLAEAGEAIDAKARAVEEILGRLRRVPGEIERSLYLKALAERSGLEERMLLQRLGGSRNPAPAAAPPPKMSPSPRARAEAPARTPVSGAADRAQEVLLYLAVNDPLARRRVIEEGPEEYFSEPALRELARQVLERAAEEETTDPGILAAGLPEDQRQRLSAILGKDPRAFAEDPERIFEDCRRATEQARRRQHLKALQQMLREAEAAGEGERCAALQREIIETRKGL